MTSWKCNHCRHKNDGKAKNCKRCNAYHHKKEEKEMECKKNKHKKVYTSGPISNATADAAQVAQQLWVSVGNYDKRAVEVKVEVLNWGDPAVSAGLTTTPVGMAVPMKAMAAPVMPAEKTKIPCHQTQHFFADLLTGGPLATPVLSFEIRVTVMSKDPDAKVIFNAVSYSAEAAEPVEEEVDVLGLEEEEVPEAAAAVTAALFSFKDFVLLEKK